MMGSTKQYGQIKKQQDEILQQRLSVVENNFDTAHTKLTMHLNYRPDIDGMRAIAVLGVLFFHIFPTLLPGGFVGVDIFFVLSGYLISSIIFKGLREGNFSFRDFYIRRIKRIFPALICVLLTVAAIGFVLCLDNEFNSITKFIRSASSFTTNLRLHKAVNYFDIETYRKPLIHIWSLSLEEQFYIFFPIAVFFSFKFKRLLLPILVVCLLASFSLNIINIEDAPMKVFYLLPTRAWELLIGSLLAYSHVFHARAVQLPNVLSHPRVSDLLSFSGLAMIFYAMFMLNDKTPFPGYAALLSTLGALFIIIAKDSFLNNKFLSQTTMVWIGLISYSLYLWHWPLMSFSYIYTNGEVDTGTRVFVFLFSFILAAATTFLIEKPIRKKDSKTAYKLAAMMTVILASSVFVSKFNVKTLPSYTTPGLDKLNYAMDDWIVVAEQLNHKDPRNFPFPSYGNGKKVVALFGDSNMEQYWPRLKKLMDENESIREKHTLVFATRGGQIPISGVEKIATRSKEIYLESAENFIFSSNVDVVVIASCWTNWMEPNIELAKKYRDQLKENVLKLKRQGKKVYLILCIPVEQQQAPSEMVERRLFSAWKINQTRSYDSKISLEHSKISRAMLIELTKSCTKKYQVLVIGAV